jgi:hypothetical protein
MEARVASSLDKLYATFARYDFHELKWASESDCNADYGNLDADNAVLGRALRDLSADDLSDYYFQAVSVVGTVDDFKHFLPRILEILVGKSGSGFAPAVLKINLLEAKFRDWPVAEKRAVLDVLRASGNAKLAKVATALGDEEIL